VYLGVFIAPIIEGEVVFIAASVLVSTGQLNPWAVLVAGALGGWTGDQMWYYALRGRLHRWLERFPRIARRERAIVGRVQRHSTLMVLGIRFLPGLRVALCAACAYAGVSPLKFGGLGLVSAFALVSIIMAVVAWGGPTAMSWIGLKGWWGVLIPAAAVALFLWWLGRATASLGDREANNGNRTPAFPAHPARPAGPRDLTGHQPEPGEAN
jgi:membrane protein DedA with SNARE-associated domain